MGYSTSAGKSGDSVAECATVLVADDDPTCRVLVDAALEGHVAAVVEAENGLAAVQAMETRAFDLAIVDLDMPVMDGFGVIERARARPETRHLPIIVITGRDDVVAIERAFALGATSFLCKPINWNVFRHQVGYVLNVARTERETRAAKEQAEKLATYRARGLAVLEKEIGDAVAKIAFSSGKGAEASLADIFASGERLQSVLKKVKRASDILTQAVPLHEEDVQATDVVAAALTRVTRELGPAASDRIDIQSEPLQATCDLALAAEALAAVIENALSYSPPGSKVIVTAVDAPPDRIRFEVKDAGEGMPEQLAEGSAEAAAPVAGTWGRGLGLGLATAKAIVGQHGGHFGIMSAPGEGTEVFLSFPSSRGVANTGWAVQENGPVFAKSLTEPAALLVG